MEPFARGEPEAIPGPGQERASLHLEAQVPMQQKLPCQRSPSAPPEQLHSLGFGGPHDVLPFGLELAGLELGARPYRPDRRRGPPHRAGLDLGQGEPERPVPVPHGRALDLAQRPAKREAKARSQGTCLS